MKKTTRLTLRAETLRTLTTRPRVVPADDLAVVVGGQLLHHPITYGCP